MGKHNQHTVWVITLTIFAALLSSVIPTSEAQVWVSGYTRSNGISVQGHYRTRPDGVESNNYSYQRQRTPQSQPYGSYGYPSTPYHQTPKEDTGNSYAPRRYGYRKLLGN